ncbi:MAG: ankyrin repeat domain-containing protein [Planctomycetota bacterium]
MQLVDRRAFLARSSVLVATLAAGRHLVPRVPRADVEAFFRAVAAGDLAEVRARLAAAPELLAAVDELGRSGFAVALLRGRVEVAAHLRAAGHAPDLHEAALALDWDLFERLATASPGRADALHPIGGTAMHAAALGGAGPAIWHVYAAPAHPNPDRPSDRVPSPLRAAFEYGDLEVAELTAAALLANGADPNAREPRGDGALHAAARRGSTELVELLVRVGADTRARDEDGLDAKEAAERAGASAVVALLERADELPRDRSTSRRARTVDGESYAPPSIDDLPLAERGRVVGNAHRDLDAVRSAVEREERFVHSVATTTEGAVEAAAHMGRRDIAEYLLERGAPCSLPTAASLALRDRVDALLAEDPLRVHEHGAHRYPLLWYAAIGDGGVGLAERLVAAGADVESQHHLGTTALHLAARDGLTDLVAFLLEHGGDPTRVGRQFQGRRETPIDLARARGNERELELLERAARAR